MTAPALTAASSMAVLAIGGAANLVASNKPMQAKSWMPQGGFIGVINGRSAGQTAVAEPNAAPSSPAAAPDSGKKIHPIGGQTGKPAPPCPFGRFPKHKPSKLPGPPKTYVPANNPASASSMLTEACEEFTGHILYPSVPRNSGTVRIICAQSQKASAAKCKDMIVLMADVSHEHDLLVDVNININNTFVVSDFCSVVTHNL